MIRALALALLLSGCTAMAADDPPIPPHGSAGKCDAARARHLTGRSATADLAAEALRLTGASNMRWIRPGTMVTMDFREDRLNIELDESDRVTRLRCG